MRALLDTIQRRWLNQVDDKTIDRATKALLALTLFITLAFGAYYYYDRYVVDNVPLVERETKRLEDMIRKDPGNAELRVSLSSYYTEKGDYDAAISQLQQVLKSNEYNAMALLALGDAYSKKGDYASAIDPYTRLVSMGEANPMWKVDTNLEGALYELSRAYTKVGRWDDAILRLGEALEIDQTDADAYYILGTAHQGKGNWDSAIEAYSNAIMYVPMFKEAYQGLTQVYDKKGYRDLAEWAKGMYSLSSGSYDEAINVFQGLLKTKPNMVEVQAGLGMAFEKKKQNEQAISAFKRAYELNPSYRPAKDGLVRLGVLPPD